VLLEHGPHLAQLGRNSPDRDGHVAPELVEADADAVAKHVHVVVDADNHLYRPQ
jgi:hypothetical protein